MPRFRRMAKAATPAPVTSPVTSPITPKGFFADKNRAFWTLQIGGWVGYFLLRSLGGLANRMGISFILPTILVTVTGFSTKTSIVLVVILEEKMRGITRVSGKDFLMRGISP